VGGVFSSDTAAAATAAKLSPPQTLSAVGRTTVLRATPPPLPLLSRYPMFASAASSPPYLIGALFTWCILQLVHYPIGALSNLVHSSIGALSNPI